jgi:multidrug efflux pump subunit AcrA (membrane-fusion protein)
MMRLVLDDAATMSDPATVAAVEPAIGGRPPSAYLRERVLKPGLFLSGRIVVETRKGALTVPRKAVGFLSGRPFVFVVDQDERDAGVRRARRLWFQEGLGAEGSVEFVPPPGSGRNLKPDDAVVVVGFDRLKDGDAVKVEGAGGVASASDGDNGKD